jgi:hypothetical protein
MWSGTAVAARRVKHSTAINRQEEVMRVRNTTICRPGDYGLRILRAYLGSNRKYASWHEENFREAHFDRRTSPRRHD